MTSKIAILGTGPMARAVSRLLSLKMNVAVWGRNDTARMQLGQYAPQVELCSELGAAVADADVVLVAISADGLNDVAQKFSEHARPNHVVLMVTRGVTEDLELPADVIRKHTCVRWIGFLGGPLHAPELSEGQPVHAVVATRYPDVSRTLARMIEGAPIQIHPTTDIIGVQVAGAVANVTALAGGMARGLELGDTATNVLRAHGLVNARTLGVELGGNAATFTGLAGIGELIPRSVATLLRHKTLGEKLGRGESTEAALQETDGRIEGIASARALARRGKERGLNINLISAVASVLDGERSAREVIDEVLACPLGLEA